jgi:hypothetical protein
MNSNDHTGVSIRIADDLNPELDALRDLLTFDNPPWVSAIQAGKRPAKGAQKYLTAYQDDDGMLVVPGGVADKVKACCSAHRVVDEELHIPYRWAWRSVGLSP